MSMKLPKGLRARTALMACGISGLDMPNAKVIASSTVLFPELFCPRNTLTRAKSSIFRWSMPLKFLISIFLNPSILYLELLYIYVAKIMILFQIALAISKKTAKRRKYLVFRLFTVNFAGR